MTFRKESQRLIKIWSVLQDLLSSESFIFPARLRVGSQAGTCFPAPSKLYEFTMIRECQEFKYQLEAEHALEGSILNSCPYIVRCPPVCSSHADCWWSRKQLGKRLLLRALAVAELASCRRAEDCLFEKGLTRENDIHTFGLATILWRAVKRCFSFFFFLSLETCSVEKNKML